MHITLSKLTRIIIHRIAVFVKNWLKAIRNMMGFLKISIWSPENFSHIVRYLYFPFTLILLLPFPVKMGWLFHVFSEFYRLMSFYLLMSCISDRKGQIPHPFD